MSPEERHADETRRVAAEEGEKAGWESGAHSSHWYPPGWPYDDLKLCLRNCPRCGYDAVILAAEMVHPMAFCHNEECRVLAWDPSRTATDTVHGFDEDDQAEAGESS